jgi:hypothetical protein
LNVICKFSYNDFYPQDILFLSLFLICPQMDGIFSDLQFDSPRSTSAQFNSDLVIQLAT